MRRAQVSIFPFKPAGGHQLRTAPLIAHVGRTLEELGHLEERPQENLRQTFPAEFAREPGRETAVKLQLIHALAGGAVFLHQHPAQHGHEKAAGHEDPEAEPGGLEGGRAARMQPEQRDHPGHGQRGGQRLAQVHPHRRLENRQVVSVHERAVHAAGDEHDERDDEEVQRDDEIGLVEERQPVGADRQEDHIRAEQDHDGGNFRARYGDDPEPQRGDQRQQEQDPHEADPLLGGDAASATGGKEGH